MFRPIGCSLRDRTLRSLTNVKAPSRAFSDGTSTPGMTMTSVKAVPRKKNKFVEPYQSPKDLLLQKDVQVLLNNMNATPQTQLTEMSHKLALLAHFSAKLHEPVPSNILKDLNTPTDIANWFSKQLQPLGARPHTRRLLKAVIQSDESPNQANDDQTEENLSLDDQINLAREATQEKFLEKLPENLKLDSKTFYKPYPEGLLIKNLRIKGVRPWRKVGEYAVPRNEQEQNP